MYHTSKLHIYVDFEKPFFHYGEGSLQLPKQSGIQGSTVWWVLLFVFVSKSEVSPHASFVCVCTSVIFSTTGPVAIFLLCSGDNEVPLHRASDRLIKNVIGSVNHILAQRGVGQAGGWAAADAAVTGGRPDNRITCREWGHKWKEETIVRCSSCPEALRTVTAVGGGVMCPFTSIWVLVMWL